MTLRERCEQAEAQAELVREKYGNEISDLKEKLQELTQELRHYQMAVAGLKWLWEQASQQPPFQL